MEPEAEDAETSDNLVPWSGSDASQDLCVSEVESYDEDDGSDLEYPLDPQPGHVTASPEQCRALPELSGSEEDLSYQEDDDDYLGESRESVTGSPHRQASSTSLSPHPEQPDHEPHAGQKSQPHSHSSSSSLGRAADMTLALTLATEQTLGASNRPGPGAGSRRVESSEEGGSSEAPPASVFFGISDEGAEQAEKWSSESDPDLCRPDRRSAKATRLGHSESQSDRQVKENKSKCKRIARLLTNAPNPQNKGALLFKKRRQRVEKFTLVSYGTGENELYREDQTERESEEIGSAGYLFEATSESELDEDYSVYHQQRNLSLSWGSVREMDALPDTKGKGVLMFAQRRKRMDEIVSEQEELRSKGIPVETKTQNIYDTKETYMHAEADYTDMKQRAEYQENAQQVNHNASRPLVPNRTAKPFLGFQDLTNAPVAPADVGPVTKKPESRFKVPVPIISNPQVWSPTGDVIASRDERISVPAIKTGILPESKRKVTNKQQSTMPQDHRLQNKGERRSYIESEEDCFSLGAEACNFMQPRTIKLKNPPPVAPKPAINPNCPPWMMRNPSDEPFIPPRSPVSKPSHSPQNQHYLQQQDWAQPQQTANHWAPDQSQATLQTPGNAWTPASSSSQLHLQPASNSQRSPVSIHSPTYSPHPLPSASRSKSDSAPHSLASCPPQAGKSHVHESLASPQAPVSGKGMNRAGDGTSRAGKGAELFARRQTRMEKFIVDAETVQANKTRSPSPTSSLPTYWRYSSNVRAPPPLSYNPLLAPFYPPSASKQAPSTSPKIKPKTKAKPKAPPKHLNTLDIMKHQPYQLDSALFKYDAVPEAPSPKPTPASKFEATKNVKNRSAPSQSPYKTNELVVQSRAEVPAKSPELVSSSKSSAHQNTKPAELRATDKRLDVTPAASHKTSKQTSSGGRPASASSQSSINDSIASAFSPASLIARGARQMAPRPKFSAKKPAVAGTQWRPVAMLH